MSITEIIALIALGISILDFILLAWDRWPHVKVGITTEDIIEEVPDAAGSVKTGKRLWIELSNHSTKRIWINSLNIEWSWYPGVPLRVHKIDLSDLQRFENNIAMPTTRFWIDVWGDTILSADADDIEWDLNHKLYSQSKLFNYTRNINYRVVVGDGLGKSYRSNKIRLNMPRFKE
jgi:hypothetical protein